jgi:DNA repair protein RadC
MKYKIKYFSFEVSDTEGEKVDSPSMVSKVFSYTEDFQPSQESVYLIVLNSGGKSILKKELIRGLCSSATITPDIIFRHVIMTGGSRFILVHNHPSGDPIPSEEDIEFSKRMIKASKIMGLQFLDHCILVPLGGSVYSMRREGVLE